MVSNKLGAWRNHKNLLPTVEAEKVMSILRESMSMLGVDVPISEHPVSSQQWTLRIDDQGVLATASRRYDPCFHSDKLRQYRPSSYLTPSKGQEILQGLEQRSAKTVLSPRKKTLIHLHPVTFALQEVANYGIYLLVDTGVFFYHPQKKTMNGTVLIQCFQRS